MSDHYEKYKEVDEFILSLPEDLRNLAIARRLQIEAYYASGNFLQKTVKAILIKEFGPQPSKTIWAIMDEDNLD